MNTLRRLLFVACLAFSLGLPTSAYPLRESQEDAARPKLGQALRSAGLEDQANAARTRKLGSWTLAVALGISAAANPLEPLHPTGAGELLAGPPATVGVPEGSPQAFEPLAPGTGRVILDWIYHGRPEVKKLPARILQIAQAHPGRKLIVLHEGGPPNLKDLAQDNPEILTLIRSANDLTPEGIAKNQRLESILGVHLWFNLLVADLLIPEARLMIKKNPDFAKEIDDPVMLLLIQHPEIQAVLEQYGRDEMLGQLREDQLHREAFEALYREKDKAKAARLLAEWFREREKNVQTRKAADKNRLAEVMKANPGAVIYVWRGTHHEGFDAGVDYGSLRFERNSRPAPEEFELVSAVLNRPENAALREAIVSGKTDAAASPLFLELTEAHFPWCGVQVALRASGRPNDSQAAYRLATEIMERARREDQLAGLTAHLQSEAGNIFTDKPELFELWLAKAIPPVLSFLRQQGYLKEVEALLPANSQTQQRSAPRNAHRSAMLRAMAHLRSFFSRTSPENSTGRPPRIAVVGASIHRDRIPLLRNVLEGALDEAAWQIFFDSGEEPGRLEWARRVGELSPAEGLSVTFFGTETEFRDFARFANGRPWEIRHLRTYIREPARLAIRLLRTVGRLDDGLLAEEGRQIRRDLDLLLNA